MAVFTGSQRSDNTRFFALQVIDNVLLRLSPEQVSFVSEKLFSYLRSQVGGEASSNNNSEPAHMRNKLAQTLSYVFIVSYAETWTTYFDDLLALNASSSPASEVGNGAAVDMYLRILRSIHDEIGDNLIARAKEITNRNNVLKDLIRERCMSQLAASWMHILRAYTSGSPPAQGKLQEEIVHGVLRVIGQWVSWIDITLVVQPEFLELVFSQFGNPQQRLVATDTLTEIISKKMKPSDKLELIALLNPTALISQMPSGPASDIDFDERVAKLSNIVALELIHIIDGTTTATSGVACSPQEIDRAEQLLMEFMPFVLQFLANEYDDTSSQVFQSIFEYLSFVRKESKKEKAKVDVSKLTKNRYGQYVDFPADSNFVPQVRLELLSAILDKIVIKMKYDDGFDDWTGGEDESEGEFLDMRARLKVMQDQIAAIDQDLYVRGLASVISRSLDSAPGSKSWQDVELGLYELSAFSESLKNGSIVTVRGQESSAARTLYELFQKMITSGIIVINHPSIHLAYIELVIKHASFFTSAQNPVLLNKVLEVFVSPLAIHNSNQKVQLRAWYLFFRFIKAVKNYVGDIAEQIFSSISSLLQIKAEVPPDTSPNDSDSDLEGGSETTRIFDNQLYLFELCGILFSVTNEDKAVSLTQRFLQPIFSDVERCLQIDNLLQDQQAILQVHHNLMALGTFARGFDDQPMMSASNGNNNTGAATRPKSRAVMELKNSTQVILVVLDRMSGLEVIRSAARFAFSRLIPLLGLDILQEITRLIQALLDGSKTHELGDFLSFLGQLMHSFRTEYDVFEMFNSLLSPLVTRMMVSLESIESEAVNGSTDAIILRRDLRRSYLQFVYNILNNGMGAILVSDSNLQAFQSIMQSLFMYAGDLDDSQVQKLAIVTLGKILAVFGTGEVRADPATPEDHVFAKGMKVTGFDNDFIFEQYSRVCWELLGKPKFNIRDAQMRMVVGEAAVLERAIYEHKGSEYLSFLNEKYLPMIGVPPNLAQEYLERMTSLNAKDFKKYFIDFVTRVTGQ